MIDRSDDLAITRQARVLGISRGSVYYRPRAISGADLSIMRRMDELHLEYPFAGSRMLRDLLTVEGFKIGRQHVTTLMKRMRMELGFGHFRVGVCCRIRSVYLNAMRSMRHWSTAAR